MKLQRRDIAFLLFSVALVVFKWQEIQKLIVYSSDLGTKHASQVFLIPFVTAGLIFMRRGEIFRNVRYGALAGGLTMAAGLAFPAVFWSVVQSPPAAAEKAYQGHLSKVDATVKEIILKGSDNKEMVFTYDAQTKMTGVDNGVQGLAGKSGSNLIVNYQENRGTNLATQVEVEENGDRLTVAIGSVLVTWVGGFLFFYGPSAFRAALFPLLFLAFCMPIPSMILEPLISILQRGSAEVAYILIKMPGTLIYREDFVFTMSGPTGVVPIVIAPECSGIRSFISMLILTLVAGQLLLKTQWKRVALVAIAIPIMIFKNGVRIATLSLLSLHVDQNIIKSKLHQEGGIPFFILALVLIYPILKILMRSETKESAGEPVLQEVNL